MAVTALYMPHCDCLIEVEGGGAGGRVARARDQAFARGGLCPLGNCSLYRTGIVQMDLLRHKWMVAANLSESQGQNLALTCLICATFARHRPSAGGRVARARDEDLARGGLGPSHLFVKRLMRRDAARI